MTPGSPTVFLLWAVLASLFLCFLLVHLWSYDRFKCLKWNSGRQPGAFNRLMTYTYILTVPLLLAFSANMSWLKFREGFVLMPSGQAAPKPVYAWSDYSKDRLLPLLFVLSIAWAFELVTHLEELTFWLFLLHQGPRKRDWFHSWEFRAWTAGSTAAIVGLPMTTLAARRDLDLCAAWIFLVGSVAGTVTTVWFLYVIGKFPAFIAQVKAGGAEPSVVVRLFRFYQLHMCRVVLRFFFTVPLIVLAADALAMGNHPVNRDPFWADLLLLVSGIGCFSSSALTLLIFFPRSFTQESGYVVKVSSPPSCKRRAEGRGLGSGRAARPPPAYPHYRHDHHPSTPKSVVYVHSADSPDVRMAAFEFPYPASIPYPASEFPTTFPYQAPAPSYSGSSASCSSERRPSSSCTSSSGSGVLPLEEHDARGEVADVQGEVPDVLGEVPSAIHRGDARWGDADIRRGDMERKGNGQRECTERLAWRSFPGDIGEDVPSPAAQRAQAPVPSAGEETPAQMHPYVSWTFWSSI
ncbi:hypothetical protein BD626DRAFT_2329 [Schizophyllum amplum]|uniref:Transmembrane protein n=1 Tax=Schizophyllum amplum TaxID=97359 RepID=A0A550CVT7_9AGAR|nr:hypothetical protein BD626DRAFT_2329 [Auriculariopsis ampla]